MDYTCPCGESFTNATAMGEHYRSCKVLPRLLRREYGRIARIIGKRLVPAKYWTKHRQSCMPGYPVIGKMYGSFVHFQVFCVGGEAVMCDGRWSYMPVAPKSWDGLLRPGQFVSDYCLPESLRAFLSMMLHIAAEEARGNVSHWTGVVPEETRREIIADAQAMLADLQDDPMIPTHYKHFYGKVIA